MLTWYNDKANRQKRSRDIRASIYPHLTQVAYSIELKDPPRLQMISKLAERMDINHYAKSPLGFLKLYIRKTMLVFAKLN